MYDVIIQILGRDFQTVSAFEELVLYVCGSLIIILTAVFIDLIYRVFRHLWR